MKYRCDHMRRSAASKWFRRCPSNHRSRDCDDSDDSDDFDDRDDDANVVSRRRASSARAPSDTRGGPMDPRTSPATDARTTARTRPRDAAIGIESRRGMTDRTRRRRRLPRATRRSRRSRRSRASRASPPRLHRVSIASPSRARYRNARNARKRIHHSTARVDATACGVERHRRVDAKRRMGFPANRRRWRR